jgi:hypothetical protein
MLSRRLFIFGATGTATMRTPQERGPENIGFHFSPTTTRSPGSLWKDWFSGFGDNDEPA